LTSSKMADEEGMWTNLHWIQLIKSKTFGMGSYQQLFGHSAGACWCHKQFSNTAKKLFCDCMKKNKKFLWTVNCRDYIHKLSSHVPEYCLIRVYVAKTITINWNVLHERAIKKLHNYKLDFIQSY
jgi:S-adenosylmethionine:diacylglycerol 3-amino-3-carboxypropyl transferase